MFGKGYGAEGKDTIRPRSGYGKRPYRDSFLDKKEEKSHALLVTVTVLLVIAAVTAGILVFFFFGKKEDAPDRPEDITIVTEAKTQENGDYGFQ